MKKAVNLIIIYPLIGRQFIVKVPQSMFIVDAKKLILGLIADEIVGLTFSSSVKFFYLKQRAIIDDIGKVGDYNFTSYEKIMLL